MLTVVGCGRDSTFAPRAAASAVGLTHADLPGFESGATGDLVAGDRAFRACLKGLRQPVAVSISPVFVGGSAHALDAVASVVSVMPRPADAAGYIAALRRRSRPCTTASLNAQSTGTPTLRYLGSPQRAGMVVTRVLVRGGAGLAPNAKETVAEIAFARGRIVVNLQTSGIGRAFPQATEDRLLARLASRAARYAP